MNRKRVPSKLAKMWVRVRSNRATEINDENSNNNYNDQYNEPLQHYIHIHQYTQNAQTNIMNKYKENIWKCGDLWITSIVSCFDRCFLFCSTSDCFSSIANPVCRFFFYITFPASRKLVTFWGIVEAMARRIENVQEIRACIAEFIYIGP